MRGIDERGARRPAGLEAIFQKTFHDLQTRQLPRADRRCAQRFTSRRQETSYLGRNGADLEVGHLEERLALQSDQLSPDKGFGTFTVVGQRLAGQRVAVTLVVEAPVGDFGHGLAGGTGRMSLAQLIEPTRGHQVLIERLSSNQRFESRVPRSRMPSRRMCGRRRKQQSDRRGHKPQP